MLWPSDLNALGLESKHPNGQNKIKKKITKLFTPLLVAFRKNPGQVPQTQ